MSSAIIRAQPARRAVFWEFMPDSYQQIVEKIRRKDVKTV
jgi:hypothetical protein